MESGTGEAGYTSPKSVGAGMKTPMEEIGLCVLALSVELAALGAAPAIANITMIGTYPRLSIQSEVGVINQIEYSADLRLTIWTILTNVSVTENNYSIVDSSTPAASRRFYRLVAFPPSTPEANGMVLIPDGQFVMGDTVGDGSFDELPVHTNYVSAFYMATNPVTKALWDEVYGWATNHGYSFDMTGRGKGPGHPVQTVDWWDVIKWCNARSEREGLPPAYYTNAAHTAVYRTGRLYLGDNSDWVNWSTGYRLPTEAEWEKAARGGSSGHRFPWTDVETVTQGRANYYSQWTGGHPVSAYDLNPTSGGHPSYDDGVTPYTSPVGSFAPNGYGLYDMAGNILQWCWDWAGDYSSTSGTDPRGPPFSNFMGGARVSRGGSWGDPARYLRCAARTRIASMGYADSEFGFRCARQH